VVRAAAVGAEDVEAPPHVAHLSDNQTTELLAELEATRRLDAVRATRRAGWDVDGKAPTAVTLVAALDDAAAREQVLQVARALRAAAVRRPTLGAVLLLCPARDEEVAAVDPAVRWALIPDCTLFDDGCYLLGHTNADGLLIFDRNRDEDGHRAVDVREAEHRNEPVDDLPVDLVACWLVLRALTGLDAALARAPLDEAATCQAFGLARWRFPLEALKALLARRWQVGALDRLLAAPQNDAPSLSFLEQHVQPRTPWPEPSAVRFRVPGASWATPALRLVPNLREALEQAVTSEQERWQEAMTRAERRIERAGDAITAALTAAIDDRVDEMGLGETQRFLDTLAEAVERGIVQCEQAVAQRFERLDVLDERVDQAAEGLEACTARFPPFRLRVLLGLIVRPWRLVRLGLLYREIGRRAGVYLAYCQSRWLLQVEAFEHQWRAALYARLAQAIRDQQDDVANLQAALEQLKAHHAPDRALEHSVVQSLEAATLPAGLVDQLYRRVVGDDGPDVRHLLALHGPLSAWVREGSRADVLGAIFLDHAWDLFAFLDQLYLDDLLAHTHSGAALRRHLAALVEAAAPWWAGGETQAPAMATRRTFVGLADAERSPLPDLLPRRHVCFSTGDRHQIVATQVVRGIQIPSESVKEEAGWTRE
jgi:hypothetical protein